MINKDKWIGSLSINTTKVEDKSNQTNHEVWISTIPKKDSDVWISTIPKKNNYSSVKKYSLTAVLFIVGLLVVSVVKNETRNIQKDINNLRASINVLKFNLNQAVLDNEVITSPENISRLAKEHLNDNFIYYKKSQIKHIDDKADSINDLNKIKVKNENKLSKKVKVQVLKKIQEKKTELKKLQEIYSNPKTLPTEVKMSLARQISEKKKEIRNIYDSPGEFFTLERVRRWGAVQVVKLFLGIPVVPGK